MTDRRRIYFRRMIPNEIIRLVAKQEVHKTLMIIESVCGLKESETDAGSTVKF